MFKSLIILFVSIFLLIGCGGSSSTNSSTGTFIDDVVSGLKYVNDSDTSVERFTDSNGKFDYEGGLVEFYIGNIKIGELTQLPSDGNVFIQDILGLDRTNTTDSKLLKIASFLQSLDSDSLTDEIEISKADFDKFDLVIDDIDNLVLNNVLSNAGFTTVVTTSDAKRHLTNSLKLYKVIEDNIPLELVSSSISDESINVALNTNIVLTFTDDIRRSFVNSSNIELKDSSDNLVALTITHKFDTVTLNPNTDLSDNETYTLTLKTNIEDFGKNSLTNQSSDTNTVISFTTISNYVAQAPISNAGSDQTVDSGYSVIIDASGSSDSDGTIASYEWKEGNNILSTSMSFTKSDFTIGTHTLVLKVTDNEGLSSSDTVVITINIINAPDTTKPVITLNGVSSLELIKGTAYTELGATATDDKDGTLTVTISGTVDFNTVGTYTLTYKAKDSSGNERSIFRTITIIREKTMLLLNDIHHGLEPWLTDGTKEGTHLVKDTELKFKSSAPASFTEVNGIIYFTANDSVHGRELWKTDGSEDGTILVKDIYTGIYSSAPNNLVNFNGMLYFEARDSKDNSSLWRSDGTKEGTVMVKNISVRTMIVVNNIIFFEGSESSTGRELWKSDGTTEGTVLVKDINPGSDGSGLYHMLDFNGVFYFSSKNSTNGNNKLWTSDGTEEGTVMVGNIPTTAWGDVRKMTYAGDIFYFRYDGDLWKSDGTDVGTVMVKDIDSINGRWLEELTYVNGVLYFNLYTDGHGEELWKSDGTSTGTVMVKEIHPSYGANPRNLTNVNNVLFFTVQKYDGNTNKGQELWKSDGTEEGTVRIKDIYKGSGSMYMRNFVNLNGILYFQASNDTDGYALWRSDGTEESTYMVKDINPDTQINGGGSYEYIQNLTNVNGVLYFSGEDNVHGFELWKSDTTDIGTKMVKNINITNWGMFYYQDNIKFVKNGSLYYFVDNNGKLWKSDTTEEGTRLVSLSLENNVSQYHNLISIKNEIYFNVYTPLYIPELWKTDGTETGTVKVSSSASLTIDMNTSVYFTLNVENNYGLWRDNSDGVVLVKTFDTYIESMVKSSNQLIFITGKELWKSDGTEVGTVKIKDLPSDINSLSSLINSNDVVYFKAKYADKYELWKSDGTEVGTVKIKDIPLGSSYPLFKANDIIYFKVDDGTGNKDSLWMSDGTEEGTISLVDNIEISNFTNNNSVNSAIHIGNTLYFRANDGIHGYELWKSNGTKIGTTMVKDSNLGSDGSYPSNYSIVDGILYYIVYGDDSYDLWKSDGTEDGTIKLKTIVSDDYWEFNIIMYGELNGELIFSVINDEESRDFPSQLWKSDATVEGTVVIDDLKRALL